MLALETGKLDLPTLLEKLVDVSDRGKRILKGSVDAKSKPLLVEVIARIDATIESLEDLLDAQEAADALEEVTQTGTVPWEQVKAELGL